MFKHKTPTLLAGTALAAGVAFLAAGPSEGASSVPITSCGQTVASNAVLTTDLNCVGSVGVFVGASGITIDLKGHVLKGGGGWWGIVDGCSCDDVTIKNGVIRNFGDGIHAVNGTDNVTVSNVATEGNALYGILIEGTSASVMSSAASGNGNIGIEVLGEKASVKSSTAAGNSYGIDVVGDGAVVRSSTATGNANTGISLSSNVASVISSNMSGNNFGLYVFGKSASIRSSVAVGNDFEGIEVAGDAANVSRNQAQGNGFAGGSSDGLGAGIHVSYVTTAPTGTNFGRANDDPAECYPAGLC
jgi:Right handed beta helix region